MWHSTGVGVRNPNRVLHIIKPRQVANIADNTAYFRTQTPDEYMGVLDFMFEVFTVYSGEYNDYVLPEEEAPIPDNFFLELGFESKWSFPAEVFQKLIKLFPEVRWSVQTQEPAMGYMSLAYFNPHNTELFEETHIQFMTNRT